MLYSDCKRCKFSKKIHHKHTGVICHTYVCKLNELKEYYEINDCNKQIEKTIIHKICDILTNR